jgi:hypothetical protein
MSVFSQDLNFGAVAGPSPNQFQGGGLGGGPSRGGYMPPPATRPVPRGQGFKTGPGYNNRAPIGKVATPGYQPRPTIERPFAAPAPKRPGTGGSSPFRQLLKNPQATPLKGGQGFGAPPPPRPATTLPAGMTGASNSGQGQKLPPWKSAVPSLRLPGGLSLPGNPWAKKPTPFQPGIGANLPTLAYPNQLSPAATAEGRQVTPPTDPPFFGGQGVGVRYRVTWGRRSVLTNGTLSSTETVATFGGALGRPGPIRGVEGRVLPEWQQAWLLHGTDSTFTIDESQMASGSCPQGCFREIRIISIARVDGQPDTDGDPPGAVEEERLPNPARRPGLIPQRLPAPVAPPTPLPELPPTDTPPGIGIDTDTPSRTAPGVTPSRWPFRVPRPNPARQPLPYISPAPANLPVTRPVPSIAGGTGSQTGILAPPVAQPEFQLVPPTTPVLLAPPIIRVPIYIPPSFPQPPTTPDNPSTTPIDPLIVRWPTPVFNPPAPTDRCDPPQQKCADLCEPVELTGVTCEEKDGKLTAVTTSQAVRTLSKALAQISAEVAKVHLLLDPCPSSEGGNEDPILLDTGTMSHGETVAYVPLPESTRQVELIITGTLPTELRLYDTTQSGEQQGKFGSICVAYPGVTGGNAPDAFHQWAWTRRTLLATGKPVRPGRKLRIYLRAGLSWVLYDTGVRS